MISHDMSSVPQHVAIIMDGNGRWAKQRGLPRREGHRAGAESIREILEAALEAGVGYLTLYAFSSENWNRPALEVRALMILLERFLEEQEPELQRREIRLQAIGQLERLPKGTRQKLEQVMAGTAHHRKLTLVLALSYGGREELVRAARNLARRAVAGEVDVEAIGVEEFAGELYTAEMPDPDLLIRTSGEMRLSNFLLWQVSYAEMVIVKKLWPDFRQADFHAALAEYQGRHRRFGAL